MGQALFPLDQAWALEASGFSPTLKRQMAWLSGLLPYAQAEAVFWRIGKRHGSDSSLWRVVQATGDHLEPSTPLPVPDPPASALPPTMLLSMDGGMVNVRDEGWKEFKVGGVGHVVGDEALDSAWVAEVQTQPVRYAAVLGEVKTFEPLLLKMTSDTGFLTALRSVIVADGALWIWHLADHYFATSEQLVDWYHAAQHLHQAAQTLFPQQPTQATAWLTEQSALLFNGLVDLIIADLTQAGQTEAAHFFVMHRTRLRYTHFQAQGYPLGSGTIESAVKQFKVRLTGPGMRWSRPGLQCIITLRAAVLDGSFDARWELAA